MPISEKLSSRYEIKEVLARGGMGVVYKAFDNVMKRQVALKTLLDLTDQTALKLFRKECEDLASMAHPNIIEIFDLGQFEEEGVSRPYLVMPLLPGVTLEKLIRSSSQRLNMERCIDIICQACRGLQAAHDKGLVHRDIKPSNIFVMDDDSVKIIDFGVAHRIETSRTIGRKGTLLYMSPEQIEMKPLTAASDIFSLGVVCYETLTRQRVFERASEESVVNAVLRFVPPPASEINPAVSPAVSQAVHKAMAKQAWYRYASAKEFSETLQKALRNEPIEIFNPARIRPRLQRASDAFEKGDSQFAADILGELEAEGHLDPSIMALRRAIDGAVRQRSIHQLLETARARMEEDELPLALQKLQELLQLDPAHPEALSLQAVIENKRTENDVRQWLLAARQHVSGLAFGQAREALQRVLQIRPKEGQALQLLAEVDRLEDENLRSREQKERFFQGAVQAAERGDISSALSKLERVLELDRISPDAVPASRTGAYQSLYDEVRSKHEAMKLGYAEAKAQIESGNFREALSLCQAQLSKFPGDPLLQALKIDIEEQLRNAISARIAETDRQVEAESDLNGKVRILEEAARENPGETHFEVMLQRTREKRDLVETIVSRARSYEQQSQFEEALSQWQILQTIYGRYPGLSIEIERLTRRRDQFLQSEAKSRWIDQIDRLIEVREFGRALELLAGAQKEFPGDAELVQLERLARRAVERNAEAERLLSQARQEFSEQRYQAGIETLRKALDPRDRHIQAMLLDILVQESHTLMNTDPVSAELLLQQAIAIEPGHAPATALIRVLEDRRNQERVGRWLSEAERLRAQGDLRGAISVVEEGLQRCPNEHRLVQLQNLLREDLSRSQRRERDVTLDLPHLAAAASANSTTLDATVGSEPPPAEPRPEIAAAPPVKIDVQPALPKAAPGARAARIDSIRKHWRVWSAVGLACVLVAGISTLLLHRRGQPTPPPPIPTSGALEVTTIPAGATILVNGTPMGTTGRPLSLRLPLGPVSLKATLPGFQDAASSPEVTAKGAVVLTLAPVLILKIHCSGDASVTINDEPAAPVKDGSLVRQFPVGTYTVKIATSSRGTMAFAFQVVPDGPAVVTTPPSARDMSGFVISNFGDQTRLYASSQPMQVKFDGKAAGELGVGGLDLPNASTANPELELSAGKITRKKLIEVGPERTLTAIVDSDPDTGTLLVQANEDGAAISVLLNGREMVRNGQTADGGRFRKSNLRAGKYTVRVSKADYEVEPGERIVEIRKGEDQSVSFKFRRSVTSVSMPVRSTPGADILVDGTRVGEVQADGGYIAANLKPGTHTFRAQKGRQSAEKSLTVTEGMPALDLTLPAAMVAVQIKRDPPTNTVTFRGPGDSAARIFEGDKAMLPEGAYRFEARAPGYITKPVTVQLSGESAPVDMTQVREAPKIALPVRLTMTDWGPNIWTREKAWWQRAIAGPILFPKPVQAGIIQFSLYWEGGGRLLGKDRIQWVLNYLDPKNHLLCDMEEGAFQAENIVQGRRPKDPPKKVAFSKQPSYTVRVRIEPDGIVQELQEGAGWKLLGKVAAAVPEGKFGFLISAGQTLYVSNFSVEPAR
jgi:eukaryotic-like serine/threonine-protein kinase